MKKTSIRITGIVLAVLMVLSVFSAVTVFAETVSGTDEEKGISWTFDTETKTLTISGSGEYQDYIYPVTEPWFDPYAHEAETLVLEGFTSIPQMAFSTPYSNVQKLVLPDSLKTIGSSAFSNMYSLEDVDFGNGVETIGSSAFQYSGLWSISLPDSVRTIEAGAFDNCIDLSKVDLGNGVETIESVAFSDTALKSVTIPDSVKTIGKQAFGYYYDESYDDDGCVVDQMLPLKAFEIHASKDNAVAAKYAKDNGFTLCTGEPSISPATASIKAGGTTKLTVKNAAVDHWGTLDFKVAVCKDGVVYGKKKGTARIVAVTVSGARLVSRITVTTNPKLTISKKVYKKGKTYTVKKGSRITVKITGKSAKFSNVYKSSKPKIAKVVSKKTAKTVKIASYKKGTTTIKITVNQVEFKFKVKVK